MTTPETTPAIGDLHYVHACEVARQTMADSNADITFGGVEDVEQLAADIINAVWPILHAPAYGDGVEAGRAQALDGARREWGVHRGDKVEYRASWTEDDAQGYGAEVEDYPALPVVTRLTTPWETADGGGT